MKNILPKILVIILSIVGFSAYASSDLIKLQVTQSQSGQVRAKMLNLDSNHKLYQELKDMELVGQAVPDSKKGVMGINWNKIKLNNSEVVIAQPFSSKIKVSKDVHSGHKFSAKGNYSSLVSAMEDVLQQKESIKSSTSKRGNYNNSLGSRSNSSSFRANTGTLPAYQNINNQEEDAAGVVVEEGDILTVNDGCLPYVDYELNTVYIQQRVIQDAEELQSCHNSATSFPLEKDYEACPDKEDSATGSKEVNFQYYYVDTTNGNDVRTNVGQCRKDDGRSIDGSSEALTTTEGCSPYVDYELNKVFIQQRILKDGSVIQSCHNSSTSFTLAKNYDACPDKQDLSLRINEVFFQYYYTDTRDGKTILNNLGECTKDSTKSGTLVVTKDYESCSQYIDLSVMRIYDQYKEYYKDFEDNDILLNDCQKDTDRSFNLVENYSSCPIKHEFEKGYSISQKEIGYTNSAGEYVKTHDCMEDEDRKYNHNTTTDTCSSVITDGVVQLFNRKYINVDGITSYITDCSPIAGGVTIQEENCFSTPFAHDFEANQSYRNKNYFYINSSGSRVDVSTCVRSDESFNHDQDSGVCEVIDNDDTKQTTLFAKTYITVDGSKEYISDCQEVSTKVSYTEIGEYWTKHNTVGSAALSVSSSGDNVYIGSSQGDPSDPSNFFIAGGFTCYYVRPSLNLMDDTALSSYISHRQDAACGAYSAPTYSGHAIDLTYSDSAISLNNYVETRSGAARCWGSWAGSYTNYTTSNNLYYQRCQSHTCDVSIMYKYPLYQRYDGTKYFEVKTLKETKYICGNGSSLNGRETLF